MNEDHVLVRNLFAADPSRTYSEQMRLSGFKKGKFWLLVKQLCEAGALKKVGMGEYISNPEIDVQAVEIKRCRKPKNQLKLVASNNVQVLPDPPPPLMAEAPIPEPIDEHSPGDQIVEVVTALTGKISALQPLLLLHKELFTEIESLLMTLIDRTCSVKPNMLTVEQMNEYREMKEIKERAVKIAQQKRFSVVR